jgi:hypothetical protein
MHREIQDDNVRVRWARDIDFLGPYDAFSPQSFTDCDAAESLDQRRRRFTLGNITVGNREIGTWPIGTIMRFVSVPLKKTGTDLVGSWWP